MNKNTIVVNLFAGPGAGKTTCAWEIASELKKRGIETEYVSEYTKELVWDNNLDMLDGSLKNQQILYNEQSRRINRLLGKVDVIVTDSPTILATMYLKEPNKTFENKAIKDFKENQNFNLFINRGKDFQQSGRIHNLQESKAIDNKIKQLLKANDIYFGTYNHNTIDILVDNIIKNIDTVNKNKYPEPEFNEFGIKEIQAENLPEGWVWQQYDDGSGHLKSPDGTDYFCYDWTTGEYKTTREDKHYDFFLDENYSTGGYSIGSFSEFKSYAENWINNNVLKIERMDKIPPPSEPTIVADYTNIPNINEDNVIMRYPNGKYYNHYGYDIETGNSSSIAGGFNTLTEATKMMYKHRYTSAQKTSIRDLLENKKSQQNSLSNENLTQSVKENQVLK